MPSASTNKPISASAPIMSSLCSRTLPVSVSATLLIFPRKLMIAASLLKSYRDSRSLRRARHAGATLIQSGRHLAARLEPLFGILGQRTVDDAFHADRQIRPEGAQARVRRLGDLLHQPGHRIGGKR